MSTLSHLIRYGLLLLGTTVAVGCIGGSPTGDSGSGGPPATVPPDSEPPFVLSFSSSTLSIMQGSATPTTTVKVIRNSFTGPVTLWVDIGDFHGTLPPGVRASFSPNPATGNSSELTLTVGTAAVPGVYDLWVYGDATTGLFWGPILLLTITAAPSP